MSANKKGLGSRLKNLRAPEDDLFTATVPYDPQAENPVQQVRETLDEARAAQEALQAAELARTAKKASYKVVSFSLSLELNEKIRKFSFEHDLKKSEIVSQALAEFFDRHGV